MTNLPSERLIIRNTLYNIAGKVLPIIIGIALIPFIIRALGTEQFGILSLAWVIMGYFSLFDLGIGQATTRFIAQTMPQQHARELSSLAWTSIFSHLLLGIIGSTAMVFFIPLLITTILAIPSSLQEIARQSFTIVIFAVPLATLTSVLRGILEGVQRYDLINLVKTPYSSLMFLLPGLVVFFPFSLPTIILFLLCSQFLAVLAYFYFCLRALPAMRHIAFTALHTKHLLGFGIWIGISNILWSLLVTIDKFFIGAFSLAAVTFYAAPFDMIARLLILPESLITLFPAFSTLGNAKKEEVAVLFTHAVKYTLVSVGSIAAVIMLFASPLLTLWLGREFSQQSTRVLQLLTLGMVFVSFTLLGETLIKGLGHPKTLTLIRIAELVVYIILLWIIVPLYGITGVALVWTLRALIDALIVGILSIRILPSLRIT